MSDWLKKPTQAYRRGYVEGQEGSEDAFLLKSGLTSPADIAEYDRGFLDGRASVAADEEDEE